MKTKRITQQLPVNPTQVSAGIVYRTTTNGYIYWCPRTGAGISLALNPTVPECRMYTIIRFTAEWDEIDRQSYLSLPRARDRFWQLVAE